MTLDDLRRRTLRSEPQGALWLRQSLRVVTARPLLPRMQANCMPQHASLPHQERWPHRREQVRLQQHPEGNPKFQPPPSGLLLGGRQTKKRLLAKRLPMAPQDPIQVRVPRTPCRGGQHMHHPVLPSKIGPTRRHQTSGMTLVLLPCQPRGDKHLQLWLRHFVQPGTRRLLRIQGLRSNQLPQSGQDRAFRMKRSSRRLRL